MNIFYFTGEKNPVLYWEQITWDTYWFMVDNLIKKGFSPVYADSEKYLSISYFSEDMKIYEMFSILY